MSSAAIRIGLRPGDVDEIVRLHRTLYASEQGWNEEFAAYVEGPLREFAYRCSELERIWIAERDDRIVGCVAIVDAGNRVAQLRWLLVCPEERGLGLGRSLVAVAIAFCQHHGYLAVTLWTVDTLANAARLYRSFGFRLMEEYRSEIWGTSLVEQRYELRLATTDHDSPNDV